MKRRDFVTSVVTAGLAAPIVSGFTDKDAEQDQSGHGGGHGDEHGRQGRQVHVSFGHWDARVAVPFDRFGTTAQQNPPGRNVHQILPNVIKAKVGDTLIFHISGLHNPQIFGPGTQPADIDTTTATGAPAIINDDRTRVFRGLDPRVLNAATTAGIQDRVESVAAPDVPGRYLVICGVRVHFVDAAGNFIMFGFIDVEPADD
jgi:hypothetical protein